METTSKAAERVAERARSLVAAEVGLAKVTPETIAEGIAAAAERLSRELDQPASPLMSRLEQQSKLSQPMIRWAAQTSLAAFQRDALIALLRAHREAPCGGSDEHPEARQPAARGTCAVILSGNVFTAPLRALAFPLLSGRTVLAKTASGQDALARAFGQALAAHDRALGDCVAVESFGRDDERATATLLEAAAVVSAYGDDETLAALRARLPAHVPLIAHGHGLGAIYLPSGALADRDRRHSIIAQVARDVAAYDQRGCLSPHHVFVEHGPVPGHTVARELHGALGALEATLPRGGADAACQAEAMQWRGVAAACGELFEDEGHAVSLESIPRTGPGHRHVSVIEQPGRAELIATLGSWGEHLKALAVPGEPERHMIERALEPRQRPQMAAPGALQTPPLDAKADGRAPLTGLCAPPSRRVVTHQ